MNKTSMCLQKLTKTCRCHSTYRLKANNIITRVAVTVAVIN